NSGKIYTAGFPAVYVDAVSDGRRPLRRGLHRAGCRGRLPDCLRRRQLRLRPLLAQILLQADAGAVDVRCRRLAHVTVVPGLVPDACDVALLRRITEDEAVLPAVLHQPLLLR
ncbi:Branched-chain amino acid transporter permease, partial [Dysosmobacter welbionis]